MKYVALLRGINVGGNNKVSMAELKVCFEEMNFTNVSTYINSGNVIFETKTKAENELAKKIEKGILKTFGFPVRVVVRSQKNIEKIVCSIPDDWKNDTEQKSDVLFLWEAYDTKKSIDLLKPKKDIDTVMYVEGAILWNVQRQKYTKSAMSNFIGTELYKNMTARNVNTVRKLAVLMK